MQVMKLANSRSACVRGDTVCTGLVPCIRIQRYVQQQTSGIHSRAF